MLTPERTAQPTASRHAARRASCTGSGACDGYRHDELFWTACRVVEAGNLAALDAAAGAARFGGLPHT